MASPYPGSKCQHCAEPEPGRPPARHDLCIGWDGPGMCGCVAGLCGLRLLTGVMWDIHEPPTQGEP